MATLSRQVTDLLGESFSCSLPADTQYLRIRTPFLYPDGDVIDVFFTQTPGGFGTLTDLGETLSGVRLRLISPRLSEQQRARIADICRTHTLEFTRGILWLQVKRSEDLGAAMTSITTGMRLVAEL